MPTINECPGLAGRGFVGIGFRIGIRDLRQNEILLVQKGASLI